MRHDSVEVVQSRGGGQEVGTSDFVFVIEFLSGSGDLEVGLGTSVPTASCSFGLIVGQSEVRPTSFGGKGGLCPDAPKNRTFDGNSEEKTQCRQKTNQK